MTLVEAVTEERWCMRCVTEVVEVVKVSGDCGIILLVLGVDVLVAFRVEFGLVVRWSLLILLLEKDMIVGWRRN